MCCWCCFLSSRQGRVLGNAFGPGNGPIWLDDIRCQGDELSIIECSHRPWGSHNCLHGEDVSVDCRPGPPTIGDNHDNETHNCMRVFFLRFLARFCLYPPFMCFNCVLKRVFVVVYCVWYVCVAAYMA